MSKTKQSNIKDYSCTEKDAARKLIYEFAKCVPPYLRQPRVTEGYSNTRVPDASAFNGDALILPSKSGAEIPLALKLFPPDRLWLVDTFGAKGATSAGHMARLTTKANLHNGKSKHCACDLVRAAKHRIPDNCLAFANVDLCCTSKTAATCLQYLAPKFKDGAYFSVTVCQRDKVTADEYDEWVQNKPAGAIHNSWNRIENIAKGFVSGRKATPASSVLRCCGYTKYTNSKLRYPMLVSYWRVTRPAAWWELTNEPWDAASNVLAKHGALPCYQWWNFQN